MASTARPNLGRRLRLAVAGAAVLTALHNGHRRRRGAPGADLSFADDPT